MDKTTKFPVSTESSKLPSIFVPKFTCSRYFFPLLFLEWRRGNESPRPSSLKFKCQSREAHIAKRERRDGGPLNASGGDVSECGVLLLSLTMSKTVAGSHSYLLSNSVWWTRSSSSKIVPSSVGVVL